MSDHLTVMELVIDNLETRLVVVILLDISEALLTSSSFLCAWLFKLSNIPMKSLFDCINSL